MDVKKNALKDRLDLTVKFDDLKKVLETKTNLKKVLETKTDSAIQTQLPEQLTFQSDNVVTFLNTAQEKDVLLKENWNVLNKFFPKLKLDLVKALEKMKNHDAEL